MLDPSTGLLTRDPSNGISIGALLAVARAERPPTRRLGLSLLAHAARTAHAGLYGDETVSVRRALTPGALLVARLALDAPPAAAAAVDLLHALLVGAVGAPAPWTFPGDAMAAREDVCQTQQLFSPLPGSLLPLPFNPLGGYVTADDSGSQYRPEDEKEAQELGAVGLAAVDPVRWLMHQNDGAKRLAEVLTGNEHDGFVRAEAAAVLTEMAAQGPRESEFIASLPGLLSFLTTTLALSAPAPELRPDDPVDDTTGAPCIAEDDLVGRVLVLPALALPVARLAARLGAGAGGGVLCAGAAQARVRGEIITYAGAAERALTTLVSLVTLLSSPDSGARTGGLDPLVPHLALTLAATLSGIPHWEPPKSLLTACISALARLSPAAAPAALVAPAPASTWSVAADPAAAAAAATALVLAAVLRVLERGEDSSEATAAVAALGLAPASAGALPVHPDVAALPASVAPVPELLLLAGTYMSVSLNVPRPYTLAQVASQPSFPRLVTFACAPLPPQPTVRALRDQLPLQWGAQMVVTQCLMADLVVLPTNGFWTSKLQPIDVLPSAFACAACTAAPAALAASAPLVTAAPAAALTIIATQLSRGLKTLPAPLSGAPAPVLRGMLELCAAMPTPAPAFPTLATAVDAMLCAAPLATVKEAPRGAVLFTVLLADLVQRAGLPPAGLAPGPALLLRRAGGFDGISEAGWCEYVASAASRDPGETLALAEGVLGGAGGRAQAQLLLASWSSMPCDVGAEVLKALAALAPSLQDADAPLLGVRAVGDAIEMQALAGLVRRTRAQGVLERIREICDKDKMLTISVLSQKERSKLNY